MKSNYLLFLLTCAMYLNADCLHDTNSFESIIKEATCINPYIVIGRVVQEVPKSHNFVNLPNSIHEKNYHEYYFDIDTILKGNLKGKLSVFCGNLSTICYKFEKNKWPIYSLMKDSTVMLFLQLDSVAANKLGKNVYEYTYAFNQENIKEIVPLCKEYIMENCAGFKKRTYDTLIVQSIIEKINSSKKIKQ